MAATQEKAKQTCAQPLEIIFRMFRKLTPQPLCPNLAKRLAPFYSRSSGPTKAFADKTHVSTKTLLRLPGKVRFQQDLASLNLSGVPLLASEARSILSGNGR